MLLSKLRLERFRNYKSASLTFGEGLNFLVGNNAQGKTNLLEAIFYLCHLSSPRTNNDNDLILFDSNETRIFGEIQTQYGSHELEVTIPTKGKKTAEVDGMIQNKHADFQGYLICVYFSPDDLKLVKGGPSERRRFMDLEISQVNPYYRHALSQYNKVLLQRNNLLKEGRIDSNLLDVFSEQLVETGTLIIEKRNSMLKRLNLLARLLQRRLTDLKESLLLEYVPSFVIDGDIKTAFANALKESLSEEKYRGYTLVGPHRDDFSMLIDDLDVRAYGSQGQQRTVVLALKLAELEFLKGEAGEYPILLLDDVFSEIDDIRRRKLFEIVRLNKVQTFISTANPKDLEDIVGEQRKVFEIKKGCVGVKQDVTFG
ncbi:MAG: DNA replication/repair protein RecF [Firmicutes bacterium]|nr:DNA replication/repair protein RecF [Bacillota bacterium]